jgi:hypothetical protein
VNQESQESFIKTGRPKSDFPTKAIRVPVVLIPVIEQMIEAFKKTVYDNTRKEKV